MATRTKPAVEDAAAGLPSQLTDADRREILRLMILTREMESRGLKLYKQGKIPGSFYDGRGQEAVSVGAAFAMSSADPICSPLIRDLGAHLVKGTDVTEIFSHYMGRENPISRGREGNIHFGDWRRGVVGMVSMLPDMMVVAVGLAMAFKMQKQERCALTFFGDGATSRGDWHEAMNWAAIDRLPVVFLMENNQLAYSTPTTRQFAVNPVHRAAGYGIESATIDGNDVEEVFDTVRLARERALDGGGPTLIEAVTTRLHGHGAHDDMSYVDADTVAEWEKRDPVVAYVTRLQEIGLDTDALATEMAELVDDAVATALETPMPDPSDATSGVFCEGEPQTLGQGLAPWSGFESGR